MDYQSNLVLKDLKGAYNCVAIIPREASLLDSECNFFQCSLCPKWGFESIFVEKWNGSEPDFYFHIFSVKSKWRVLGNSFIIFIKVFEIFTLAKVHTTRTT